MSASGKDRQSGYVMATTALLLIPLMVFAAFAVDVGGWYVEADEAQRAADSAALAGVVYMPSLSVATEKAKDSAEANGFSRDSVSVERVGSQGLKVTINAEGETNFGKVVGLDEVPIDRFAAAEYILPVPLGNPGSSLGAGLDPSPVLGAPSERMLLALNGYCAGYDNGDPFGVGFLGNNLASGCTAGDKPNPRYNPEGYFFVVDFSGPTDTDNPVRGQWDLQILEPGLCGQVLEAGGPLMETTLWAGDDTLITDADNLARTPVVSTRGNTVQTWDSTECGSATSQWVSAYSINADVNQGRWLLRTRAPSTTGNKINQFGLRVVPAGGGPPCGSVEVSTTCPQLYAKTWLPIFIPSKIRTLGGSDEKTFAGVPSALFYLANVDSVHKGKTLEVKLFDPGEGMDNMQVIAPDRSRPPFERSVLSPDGKETDLKANDYACSTTPALADSVSISGVDYECLDVTGKKYDGDEVKIRIQIPNDYDCGSDCWWRIRYQPENLNTGVTDRTTWSVRVIGDPVRLTE